MVGLDAILSIGTKLVDKLIPDPEAKAKAQLELQKMAQEGELARLANETKLYETEQNNLTARVQADMASDSWLSKNIRPMTLIFCWLRTLGLPSLPSLNTRHAVLMLSCWVSGVCL